jgi:hypothetical protein
MLTALDDALWHQIPSTFDHVGTSDPRFFDRYWFAIYSPENELAMQVTMGSYSNMNVLDAGAVVLTGSKQHNLRVSRALRPRFVPAVGPLRITPVEPMRVLRLECDPGEHAFSFDLTWTAELPPEEEHPHFSRLNGRIQEDYQRFNQIGAVSGTLVIQGRERQLQRTWSARDHSWGVRPGMGGPQPVNGERPSVAASGRLFCFLFFSTPHLAGHVQIAETGGERTYLTGLLRRRSGDGWLDMHVREAVLSLGMFPATRRPRNARLTCSLDDGSTVVLDLESAGSSIAMPGLGYGGWADRQGLGAYRGVDVREHETWDVSHPVDVISADGTVERPLHRIQPVRVSVLGEHERGMGSLTLIAAGPLPKYGLA